MMRKWPLVLFLIYLVLFILLAIKPYNRAVWWAENIPIMLIVVFLLIISRYYQFSNSSYFLMFFLIAMHTVGGHFTFERVPFNLITNLFGFERNHYDRLAHFTVGFYAYPIAEFLLTKKLVNSKTVLYLFAVFSIVAVAAVYEIIEWLYAVSAETKAGTAMLGSQGDLWDAQKDMLADTLGAIFALLLFRLVYRKSLIQIQEKQKRDPSRKCE
jgi:putative membrane protein